MLLKKFLKQIFTNQLARLDVSRLVQDDKRNYKKTSLETAVSPTCSTALLGNLRVPFISPPTDATILHLFFHLCLAAVLHLILHLSCFIYMKPSGTWNVSHQHSIKGWVAA